MLLDTLLHTLQYIIVIFDLAYGCARSGSLPHPTETPSPETPSRHPGREQRRIPPEEEEKEEPDKRGEAGEVEAAGDRECLCRTSNAGAGIPAIYPTLLEGVP